MSDISKTLLPKAESRKPTATFRFIYTRCKPDGTILEHIAETISAHTLRSAKLTLVKRFALQNWTPWRQTADGGYVKTRTTYAYRGKIIISNQ